MSDPAIYRATHFDSGRQGYAIACGAPGCGEVSPVRGTRLGPEAACQLLPAQFEKLGWIVGRKPSANRCPSCARSPGRKPRPSSIPEFREEFRCDCPACEADRAPPPKAPDVPPVAKPEQVNPSTCQPVEPLDVSASTASKPLAGATLAGLPNGPAVKPPTIKLPVQPPRAMTRDERRLIFAKLEEVYLDERSGYSAGWSDARVAKDMGVPVAYVRTVRDENFGSLDVDEETAQLLGKGPELLAEFQALKLRMAAIEVELKPLAGFLQKNNRGA